MHLAELQAHVRILTNVCGRRKEGRRKGGREGVRERWRAGRESGFYYLILTTE